MISNLFKTVSICLMAVSVAGCASNNATFKNAEGKIGTCYSTGFGVIGTVVAESAFQRCKQRAMAAGYVQQ
jgi:hypothetical protein